MVDAPDPDRYPEVALKLQPGDLSFHAANMIHRTGPNCTGDQRRNLGFIYKTVRAKKNEGAIAEAARRAMSEVAPQSTVHCRM
eukprot:SAG31_NODE_14019_length_831_cov_1.418033_1_plen_83_part_01